MASRVALYSVGAERLIQTSALWCMQYANACVYYNVSSIILYMYVNTWDTHNHYYSFLLPQTTRMNTTKACTHTYTYMYMCICSYKLITCNIVQVYNYNHTSLSLPCSYALINEHAVKSFN